MLRIILSLLFCSLSLFAIRYPQPYSTLAGPLFEARVNFDPLVYHPELRHPVLAYEAESDRILGRYLPLKKSSPVTEKEAYYKALMRLQQMHNELLQLLQQQLRHAIAVDHYPLFLAIIGTKIESYYENPYLREKIYTYYHAHRSQGYSCYLDHRIKREWDAIASYYPRKALVNYAELPEALYREVTLLTTKRSPYSAKARAFLKANNVKFKEYDIETDTEGRALFEHSEGHYIPLLIINNRVLEGYNEFEMDKLLRR